MFSAAVGGFNYVTVALSSGRITTISTYRAAYALAKFDSSNNLFFTDTYNNGGTINVLAVLVANDGTVTSSYSWANSTSAKVPIMVAIDSTGSKYISFGSAVVSSNTYNEVIRLNSSGATTGTQSVFYGTSTSIYFDRAVGCYVDTTNNLSVYSTQATTNTIFLLKATATGTPSSAASMTYSSGLNTLTDFQYSPAKTYGLSSGGSDITSSGITTGIVVVSSGSTFATHNAIQYSAGAGNRPTTFNAICLDASDSNSCYAVGYTTTSGLIMEPAIVKVDITSSTPSSTWYKIVTRSGAYGSQQFTSVSTDSSGNVYAVGKYSASVGFLIKFDSSGNITYGRTFTFSGTGLSSIGASRCVVNGSTINMIFTTNMSSNLTVVLQLPTDGTLTGTTVINGLTMVYASQSFTLDATSTLSTATPTLGSSTITPTNSSTSRSSTSRSLTINTSVL